MEILATVYAHNLVLDEIASDYHLILNPDVDPGGRCDIPSKPTLIMSDPKRKTTRSKCSWEFRKRLRTLKRRSLIVHANSKRSTAKPMKVLI